jgi:hypothetical protein
MLAVPRILPPLPTATGVKVNPASVKVDKVRVALPKASVTLDGAGVTPVTLQA